MYATDVCALVMYHRMQHVYRNQLLHSLDYVQTPPIARQMIFPGGARRIVRKRLGLLNFTWGSWKLCVGSPTVSNFSKLVSTPVVRNVFCRTAQNSLHFTLWRPCSFQQQLDFFGKHSAGAITAQKRICSHVCTGFSTTNYSQILIYTAE